MNDRLDSAQPYAVGLFRIVVGLLFACHGAATLFGVLGGEMAGATSWPRGYAALIQLVAGGLVLIGLGTRPAALLASGSMAYAYFTVHLPMSLWPMENGGEAAAMFSWTFLLLAFTGSGAFGVDRLFGRSGAVGRSGALVTRDEKNELTPAQAG